MLILRLKKSLLLHLASIPDHMPMAIDGERKNN